MSHNSLRDDFFFRCLCGGIEVEHEMSGLLPIEPRRRPADVFLWTCLGYGFVAWISLSRALFNRPCSTTRPGVRSRQPWVTRPRSSEIDRRSSDA